jgi:hypothetical protein
MSLASCPRAATLVHAAWILLAAIDWLLIAGDVCCLDAIQIRTLTPVCTAHRLIIRTRFHIASLGGTHEDSSIFFEKLLAGTWESIARCFGLTTFCLTARLAQAERPVCQFSFDHACRAWKVIARSLVDTAHRFVRRTTNSVGTIDGGSIVPFGFASRASVSTAQLLLRATIVVHTLRRWAKASILFADVRCWTRIIRTVTLGNTTGDFIWRTQTLVTCEPSAVEILRIGPQHFARGALVRTAFGFHVAAIRRLAESPYTKVLWYFSTV